MGVVFCFTCFNAQSQPFLMCLGPQLSGEVPLWGPTHTLVLPLETEL